MLSVTHWEEFWYVIYNIKYVICNIKFISMPAKYCIVIL